MTPPLQEKEIYNRKESSNEETYITTDARQNVHSEHFQCTFWNVYEVCKTLFDNNKRIFDQGVLLDHMSPLVFKKMEAPFLKENGVIVYWKN